MPHVGTDNTPPSNGDTRAGDYIAFRPALTGPFASRFYETAQHLASNQPDYEDLADLIEQEISWATHTQKINVQQRRIYRAAWMLFRDLVRVGWRYRWLAGTLEVGPPANREEMFTAESVQSAKETIRQAMLAPRLEKISEGQDFIRRMETPNEQGVSIRNLLADGPALADDLRNTAKISDKNTQQVVLRQQVKPYLQLVTEERCQHTGYRLGDIWRYFRLTWATPAENTPGRTMLYLVRDAARPYHPVMGIASLENAPLRIAVRDDYLGWSVNSFEQRAKSAPAEAAVRGEFERLLDFIAAAIAELNISDLCSVEECENPTPATYQKLRNIAARSQIEREQALQQWQLRLTNKDNEEDEELAADRSELGNISLDAEKALYRRKRAERLSQLLFARDKIRKLLKVESFGSRWREFLSLKTGKGIIRTALQAQKSRHVGTSIMELNVCGAIPPYNEILGGKLTAMLVLSPQVVDDYRTRYGQRPSDIATRMKGEDVIRPAEIVFLGTTSLYRYGASQYNRLKLPANLLKADAREVKWEKLGATSGYGTLHISSATLKALEEAASDDGVTYVNHIFGEGASPKLRALRQAFDVVLASGPKKDAAVEFTRHSMSRLVYGVWLAANGHDFLAGQADQPDYYFDISLPPEAGTEQIADYWRERWLQMRISQPDVLDRVARFVPEQLLVGQNLEDDPLIDWQEIKEEPPQATTEDITNVVSLRDLTQNLYRGLSAYADNMTPEWLNAIHVKTTLDDEVIKAAANGQAVVLTGNPGDGKTHLLRVLAPQLIALSTRPVVELDASAIANDALQVKWAQATAQGRPFCVAINEAVLKDLADAYPDFTPVQEAQRQVEQAITYSAEPSDTNGLVVFDLSRRNILDAVIVEQVIARLTDPQLAQRCESCPTEGCDMVQNQILLNTERVRQRLQALLDRVSRRGYHATLRELQALISFLLFGGRACNLLLKESGNEDKSLPQQVYGGEGALFQQIRHTFDPTRVSHPVWDDRLIGAETDPADWLDNWFGQRNALSPDDKAGFEARKRAFYFFHKNGDGLLTLDSNDETEFAEFLRMPPTKALRLFEYVGV